jgi:hypothetical protein
MEEGRQSRKGISSFREAKKERYKKGQSEARGLRLEILSLRITILGYKCWRRLSSLQDRVTCSPQLLGSLRGVGCASRGLTLERTTTAHFSDALTFLSHL